MFRSCDHRRFDGFGPCGFRPHGKLPTMAVRLPAEVAQRRGLIRRECGKVPGVYGMVDAQGDLIYVGKSKSLADRLVSHCSATDADSKSRRILERTERLWWETWPDEFAALLRELELIRRWQPRFNVQGQPGRLRRTFLCLGRGPAAYAYLASEPSPRAEWLFGPLPGIRRWRPAVRRLNDLFGLRDCPDRVPIVFADQLILFVQGHTPACMRYDLGTCLGPCAGRCTHREYADRVRAAAGFLAGSDLSILADLDAAMRMAAAGRQFERAAALRDAWADLSQVQGQLQSLRDAQANYSFVYPLASCCGGATWYFVRHGQVVVAAAAPRDRRTAARCLRLVEHVFDQPSPAAAMAGAEDLDVLLLVAGWFRRRPDQLETTLSPAAATALCRAKGRADVRAA